MKATTHSMCLKKKSAPTTNITNITGGVEETENPFKKANQGEHNGFGELYHFRNHHGTRGPQRGSEPGREGTVR